VITSHNASTSRQTDRQTEERTLPWKYETVKTKTLFPKPRLSRTGSASLTTPAALSVLIGAGLSVTQLRLVVLCTMCVCPQLAADSRSAAAASVELSSSSDQLARDAKQVGRDN